MEVHRSRQGRPWRSARIGLLSATVWTAPTAFGFSARLGRHLLMVQKHPRRLMIRLWRWFDWSWR